MTPDHVQWLVEMFHVEREDCGSSEMDDFMDNRALYSGNRDALAARVWGACE